MNKTSEKEHYTVVCYFLTETDNRISEIQRLSKSTYGSTSNCIDRYLLSKVNLYDLAKSNDLKTFLRININK